MALLSRYGRYIEGQQANGSDQSEVGDWFTVEQSEDGRWFTEDGRCVTEDKDGLVTVK